jgi:hypothetical protein
MIQGSSVLAHQVRASIDYLSERSPTGDDVDELGRHPMATRAARPSRRLVVGLNDVSLTQRPPQFQRISVEAAGYRRPTWLYPWDSALPAGRPLRGVLPPRPYRPWLQLEDRTLSMALVLQQLRISRWPCRAIGRRGIRRSIGFIGHRIRRSGAVGSDRPYPLASAHLAPEPIKTRDDECRKGDQDQALHDSVPRREINWGPAGVV